MYIYMLCVSVKPADEYKYFYEKLGHAAAGGIVLLL